MSSRRLVPFDRSLAEHGARTFTKSGELVEIVRFYPDVIGIIYVGAYVEANAIPAIWDGDGLLLSTSPDYFNEAHNLVSEVYLAEAWLNIYRETSTNKVKAEPDTKSTYEEAMTSRVPNRIYLGAPLKVWEDQIE